MGTSDKEVREYTTERNTNHRAFREDGETNVGSRSTG